MPNHLIFHLLTKVVMRLFLQTSSLVTWLLCELFSYLRKHFLTKAFALFSSSVVKVHDSQAYRNMNMTMERISFTFDAKDMLLSLHNGFCIIKAAVAFAILQKISGFEHVTVPSFCPLTMTSLSGCHWHCLQLVWSFEFLLLFYTLCRLCRYPLLGLLVPLFCQQSTAVIRKRQTGNSFPPNLIFPSCSCRASDIILSRTTVPPSGAIYARGGF